jgi:hypothetical protein
MDIYEHNLPPHLNQYMEEIKAFMYQIQDQALGLSEHEIITMGLHYALRFWRTDLVEDAEEQPTRIVTLVRYAKEELFGH